METTQDLAVGINDVTLENIKRVFFNKGSGLQLIRTYAYMAPVLTLLNCHILTGIMHSANQVVTVTGASAYKNPAIQTALTAVTHYVLPGTIVATLIVIINAVIVLQEVKKREKGDEETNQIIEIDKLAPKDKAALEKALPSLAIIPITQLLAVLLLIEIYRLIPQ